MPRTRRGNTIPSIVSAARDLRREMTQAERILWYVLRERKFSGLKFRRQHPIGPYVLDFFCTEKMLAVELDGEVHNHPVQAELDAERTQYLNQMGVRVLRIKNEELKRMDLVLEKIIIFVGGQKNS